MMTKEVDYAAKRRELIDKWWAAKFALDRQQQIALQRELDLVTELLRARKVGRQKSGASESSPQRYGIGTKEGRDGS
jgi:hypothetical protein